MMTLPRRRSTKPTRRLLATCWRRRPAACRAGALSSAATASVTARCRRVCSIVTVARWWDTSRRRCKRAATGSSNSFRRRATAAVRCHCCRRRHFTTSSSRTLFSARVTGRHPYLQPTAKSSSSFPRVCHVRLQLLRLLLLCDTISDGLCLDRRPGHSSIAQAKRT